ncbi:putative peptidoglycan binding protein [Novosphingobium kunmingense]|uniref:Putative peptidoglycan binding protein n=1 Tax=Novosphingobium kunmingense TaxID=1211806 RepID=A0A2N0H326_9SPHN|nr:L,D-transpeptidase family protein [Novosphingobium kunmingense]PKB13328.1 putative peptidoglycan binding protein [Novosphingobium kunmingense]
MRLIPVLATLPVMLAIAACDLLNRDDRQAPADVAAQGAPAPAPDPMAAHDLQPGTALPADLADDQPRPVMQAQVVLDRLGFTPGVVDGKEGLSTRNALLGFQEANGFDQTGKLDDATKAGLARFDNIPATRVVTIPADFAAGPFLPIPDKAADQAKLLAMGYTSLDEKLAERFHTTIDTLKALNPGGVPAGAPRAASPTPSATPSPMQDAKENGASQPTLFRAGQQIRVPNVGADAMDARQVSDAKWRDTLAMLGVGTTQPKAARIVVSKSKGTLKVYDANDKLVGMFTATMGSQHDPLPLGNWKILGVARNPPFHYNPELFWDVDDGESKELLPPGPNGPVGVAWIDLSKEHYGIHGTPEPQTIGRAQSHGCVRLTNWDVARLAQMVSGSTKVLFEA